MLYQANGLRELDARFVEFLFEQNRSLHDQLLQARAKTKASATPCLPATELSQLLIDLAATVETFLVVLFRIESDHKTLASKHQALNVLLDCKKKFVMRKALRNISREEAMQFDAAQIIAALPQTIESDHDFVALVEQAGENLAPLLRYAAWAVLTPEGQRQHSDSTLFHQAQGVDPDHRMRLAQGQLQASGQTLTFVSSVHALRRGFSLTDHGGSADQSLDQARYCSHCHSREQDSCRHGMPEKKLSGCPLDERISEFLALRSEGKILAALTMICLDNPLLAATGHRICNDCVKACIFQQQDGVDIPQAETQVLRQVLDLPWGLEIYSLLTRWNPLNFAQPYPLENSGKTVMVVGQGPAGFATAHHLLNFGHSVLAIDGLRITPWTIPFEPIQRWSDWCEDLAVRTQAGFGGVAEYGITSRWDKNFLTLIRLLLERRSHYQLIGSTRLGSNITISQAWNMGVDHIALAIGAGQPSVLNLPAGLPKGVRTASDFLMALHLTGAARSASLSRIQIRMPIVVIGGGLTAVDAATEALAYYPEQVKNFALHYQAIKASEGSVQLTQSEQAVADEFLTHAAAIADNPSKLPELLQTWGGATIAYRGAINSSPAYRLNHEELEHALKEGVRFIDRSTPIDFECSQDGTLTGIWFETPKGRQRVEAGTVLMAVGTQANTIIAKEDPQRFSTAQGFLQFIASAEDIDSNDAGVNPATCANDSQRAMVYREQLAPHTGKLVSVLGDSHPDYAGNVVKALTSAQQISPMIDRALRVQVQTPLDTAIPRFNPKIAKQLLSSKLISIRRLTPQVIEMVVESPLAAQNFQPGQFYRVQDTEGNIEAIALTGASVNKERGLLSLIVLEMGASSQRCAQIAPNSPISLMGPTGAPSDLPQGKKVLLIGGGLGNAVLFSIGQALRQRDCHVVYFAAYKQRANLFLAEQIAQASDTLVWCFEASESVPQDDCSERSAQVFEHHGNVIDALKKHQHFLSNREHALIIGSDQMMAAVSKALPDLGLRCPAMVSVNSPMQCMMKGVCGQCIQRLIDPKTGAVRIVFTCMEQDQLAAQVDWQGLHWRLGQNSLHEKIQ